MANSSYGARRILPLQLYLPMLIESANGNRAKSLDTVIGLRPETLSVYSPKTNEGLVGSDGGFPLRAVLLKTQQLGNSVPAPTTAKSTRSGTGFKKGTGLRNISNKIAT